MAKSEASKESLIKNLQSLSKNGFYVSRKFYRENGKYKESNWEKFFGTFGEFQTAAGVGAEEVAETHDLQGNNWTITAPETDIESVEDLVTQFKIDTRIWNVNRLTTKRKITKTGESVYDIVAYLGKKQGMVDAIGEIEELKKEAKRQARKPEKTTIVKDTGFLLEINIPDVHAGRQSWPVETGYEPYDTKIAELMHNRAVDHIIDRTSTFKFDRILYVVGNDLFNSDDVEYRTTAGTVVTSDGRYQKTFYKVREMVTATIEKLRKIAPVDVLMVSGNHDTLSVWQLGDSLECYFHNYTDVNIENTPRTRKYYEYGSNMIMLTHGDKGKREDYPLMMAAEEPEMWGRTFFKEVHTGHNHQSKLQEFHGVKVRTLSSLAPVDDWHSENGYIGNMRQAEGFVWSKVEGNVALVTYNDSAHEPIITKREVV